MIHSYLLVALGGALGAVARFTVGKLLARASHDFPDGTLLINLTGCFAIALFLSAAANRESLSEGWRYLFPIGFVGAYTTFSTYEWELYALAGHTQWLRMGAYFVVSNVGGFVAVLLGSWLGKKM